MSDHELRRIVPSSQDSPRNLRRSREPAKSVVATGINSAQVTVGVSLKTYFAHERARAWFADLAQRAAAHPAVTSGEVRVFVVPTYPQILPALEAFAGTPVLVGAQDVSEFGPGAYTGEVTAAELAELGVAIAEVGHAERRRLFGETDAVTARKAAAALSHGLTPVLCVGETDRLQATDTATRSSPSASAAAAATVTQLEAALLGAPAGAVIAAYEPVWAIGASEPAPADHIATVTRALTRALAADPAREGSVVIYGGSARPGLLTALGDAVDGLFLGRFAHDPDAFVAVLDEASALARRSPREERSAEPKRAERTEHVSSRFARSTTGNDVGGRA